MFFVILFVFITFGVGLVSWLSTGHSASCHCCLWPGLETGSHFVAAGCWLFLKIALFFHESECEKKALGWKSQLGSCKAVSLAVRG